MTNPNPYGDLSRKIYFSYWSWNLIKHCPQSYYLNVIKKEDRPKGSLHNALVGGVPDAQATDFFRIPNGTRDMNFFIDTFESYWQAWIKENFVDFKLVADKALKDKDLTGTITDPDELYQFGVQLKYAETKEACSNLMRLIAHMNLHKMEVQTQVSFNVTLEPAVEQGNVFTPELAIGGRIDLVVALDSQTEEIWDVKAVKSPNSMDTDQLLIYKMGRQAAGKTVRRVGYLHAKQCKAETKKLLPVHETQIKKLMRQAMVYFRNDSWPANYVPWSCGYCDVRTRCETYKKKISNETSLKGMVPGKAEF